MRHRRDPQLGRRAADRRHASASVFVDTIQPGEWTIQRARHHSEYAEQRRGRQCQRIGPPIQREVPGKLYQDQSAVRQRRSGIKLGPCQLPFLASPDYASACCRREHADYLYLEPESWGGSYGGTKRDGPDLHRSCESWGGLHSRVHSPGACSDKLRHLRSAHRAQQTPSSAVRTESWRGLWKIGRRVGL